MLLLASLSLVPPETTLPRPWAAALAARASPNCRTCRFGPCARCAAGTQTLSAQQWLCATVVHLWSCTRCATATPKDAGTAGAASVLRSKLHSATGTTRAASTRCTSGCTAGSGRSCCRSLAPQQRGRRAHSWLHDTRSTAPACWTRRRGRLHTARRDGQCCSERTAGGDSTRSTSPAVLPPSAASILVRDRVSSPR